MTRQHLAIILLSACFIGILFNADIKSAQLQPARTAEFDVASIKQNRSGENRRWAILRQPGGRFLGTNVTAKMLIQFAFDLPGSRIIGGPTWITVDHFDVEARALGFAGMMPRAVMATLVDSLLQDRFHLKVHHEMRQFSVYELVIAKGGLRMQHSPLEDPTIPDPPTDNLAGPGPRGSLVGRGPGKLVGNGVPVTPLVNLLTQFLGRPVIDKTNLDGLFSFTLQWAPDPSPQPLLETDESRPIDANDASIVTALQEQLGLRLQPAKASLDVLMIDDIQEPSEN